MLLFFLKTIFLYF